MLKKALPFLILVFVNVLYFWLVLPIFQDWGNKIYE